MRKIPYLSNHFSVEKFDRIEAFSHPALKCKKVALWIHGSVHLWTYDFIKSISSCFKQDAKLESDAEAGRFMSYCRR